MRAPYVAAAVLLITSCSLVRMEGSPFIERDKTAIDLCYETFAEMGGAQTVKAIDRVYVFFFDGEYQLSFNHGEIGFFGEANKNAHQVFICGVRGSDSNTIYYLAKSLDFPIIGNLGDFDDLNYRYPHEVIPQSLYVKKDNEFVYIGTIKHDLAEFERLIWALSE